jgi:hypothetical protein
MQGKEKERWFKLCEQASTEQDPKQLSVLVKEIDRLLQEKQDRNCSPFSRSSTYLYIEPTE